MAETTGFHELDLPLLSNIEDVTVYHYVLDLECHFNEKQFVGSITLFCKHTNNLLDTHENSHSGHGPSSDNTHCGIARNCSFKQTGDDASEPELESNNTANIASNTDYIHEETLENKRSYIQETDSIASESLASLKETQHIEVEVNNSEEDKNACISDVIAVQHCWNSQPKVTEAAAVCEKCGVTTDVHVAECGNTQVQPASDTECFRKSVTCTCISQSSIGTEHGTDVNTSFTSIHRKNAQLYKHRHKQFQMILDSWDIDVESVEEIKNIGTDFLEDKSITGDKKYSKYIDYSKTHGEKLEFVSEMNNIKIMKCIVHTEDLPNVIKIQYKTDPKGHSLKWTKDQDGRHCVFTHGHWINNRSLFPSQDIAVAMATWQACIHAPIGAVVLMGGDENPTTCHENEGYSTHLYHTNMAMPSSTLSLAVGYWSEVEIVPQPPGDLHLDPVLPCRLFTPRVHQELATDLMREYMTKCMMEAAKLLGDHPFRRLDILVVPASFCSLGMASPSLMFISQSVLTKGMSIRLAHELSHSWFGLLIGPKDWTEEWLSEGFCTYLEACIHARVMGWSDEYKASESQVRDLLAFKTLTGELESSNQETLQTLRPNKGETATAVNGTKYVINGMNPDKHFMQVHYIKGFFLLKYLEKFVGEVAFHEFLKCFVTRYAGKLILSQDFVGMLFDSHPSLSGSGITEGGIYSEWLDYPGLPSAITDLQVVGSSNTLAQQVYTLVREIKIFSKNYQKLHWRKRRKLEPASSLSFIKFDAVQLLLFLDELLQLEKAHLDLLNAINTYYDLDPTKKKSCCFGDHNADVQHKWCELIVKHRHGKLYSTVRYFLLNHQAMGVYLFGELIVSLDKDQRYLAEQCFQEISADMEEGVYRTVHMMVYGY